MKTHRGLLFKIVRSYAREAMDYDDLFQEIAIQVWRSIPAFRNESAVTTWIYRIGINTAIKWSKRERKEQDMRSLNPVEAIIFEKSSESDDRLDWLYEQIKTLDEIDRSIALLMLDGLSYREMAAILGITESNVGVKINRIKKQLITNAKLL